MQQVDKVLVVQLVNKVQQEPMVQLVNKELLEIKEKKAHLVIKVQLEL